ncbi:MAG: MerR family transcriptional regulator [Candidatus Marinimicrobia bacterium]|nr:MerR family transcriptional regulator [Candidatus Neomarinimicrobiota bacterium]
MTQIISISEAAKILGVNKETLRRWDNNGKFPSKRHPINNYRVYSLPQINELHEQLQIKYRRNEQGTDKIQKPYFSTDKGSLYQMDAVKFLESFEDESVDLVFADPPYNINKAEWDSFNSQEQYVDWSLQWIKETQRVLRNEGTLYICGYSEILADLKWAASKYFKGCKWLVWYYRNKGNLGNDWGRSHESLLHLRKSNQYTFNIDDIRIPYNSHTTKYPVRPQAKTSHFNNNSDKQYVWEPHPRGAKPKDVFEIPTISNGSWERKAHPTQKPVELIKKCILASSNPGDLVIDPFGGSGTTYAVAEALNRKWAGTDKSIEYCEIIKDRLSDGDHISRIASGKDEAEARVRRRKLRVQ